MKQNKKNIAINFSIDEKLSFADRRSLFESISKETQFGGTLPRSKASKYDE